MTLTQSDKDDIRTIIHAEVAAPIAEMHTRVQSIEITTNRLQKKLENGSFVKVEDCKEQNKECIAARSDIKNMAESNSKKIVRIIIMLAGGAGAAGAGFGIDKLLGML